MACSLIWRHGGWGPFCQPLCQGRHWSPAGYVPPSPPPQHECSLFFSSLVDDTRALFGCGSIREDHSSGLKECPTVPSNMACSLIWRHRGWGPFCQPLCQGRLWPPTGYVPTSLLTNMNFLSFSSVVQDKGALFGCGSIREDHKAGLQKWPVL